MSLPLRGSQYTPHLYQPGDIVRWHSKWGVCIGYRVIGVPFWAWYDWDGTFIDEVGSVHREISAAYDYTHAGIPEAVLVRGVAARLEHS